MAEIVSVLLCNEFANPYLEDGHSNTATFVQVFNKNISYQLEFESIPTEIQTCILWAKIGDIATELNSLDSVAVVYNGTKVFYSNIN